jgi:arginine-tRNA-protein transferase
MNTIACWADPPRRCIYQPDHISRRQNLWVATLAPEEYMAYLVKGWRRFGHILFRQNCSGPGACRSLRVDVVRFTADRSQRRARKANEGAVRLHIGTPAVMPEKVVLFERFHADRSERRGWPEYKLDDTEEFARNFVLNPFRTEEWCYFLDDVLIGVGYVDQLAGGLSAIYFARDPQYSDRSLGTWSVLSLIDRASALGLPHVYLGYHVDGCPSLRYKARFRPNESLDPDGVWRDGRT